MSARRKTKTKPPFLQLESVIGRRTTAARGVEYLVEITNNPPIWIHSTRLQTPLERMLAGLINPHSPPFHIDFNFIFI